MASAVPDVCPLCLGKATLEQRAHESLWVVDCAACRRFTVDNELFALLRDPATREQPPVRDLLPFLSQATAKTWADGGRLNVSLENWRAVAHDVAGDSTRH